MTATSTTLGGTAADAAVVEPSPRAHAAGPAPKAAPAKVTSKVPAAENTLRILKLLASKRGPMAASNIATALGLPRSSVYHLLGVMEANGFVLHLHEEQRYGLGISAFELSSAYSRQEPLSRLGRPLLAALVDVIGESAHLAVLHGRCLLYTSPSPRD